jgi:hypothetical protein
VIKRARFGNKILVGCLAQLVRFLVVELIHSGSNLIFDMSVVFLTNYSFSGRQRTVNSEVLLEIDFVNLEIKFFRCTHRDRICVSIGMSALIHV